jgi:hypothetical protein
MTSNAKSIKFVKDSGMRIRPTMDSLSWYGIKVALPDRYAKFLGESPYMLELNTDQMDEINKYTIN